MLVPETNIQANDLDNMPDRKKGFPVQKKRTTDKKHRQVRCEHDYE